MGFIMTMNQEKLRLTWNNYTDHLRAMLYDMMSSNDLTDVTLVTEDKKQFKAHKFILLASSPVFKSIIKDCFISSPFIFLRGIQSDVMEAILQFIYLGKASICPDRLNVFLEVAKCLEIKEIRKETKNEEIDNENGETTLSEKS